MDIMLHTQWISCIYLYFVLLLKHKGGLKIWL